MKGDAISRKSVLDIIEWVSRRTSDQNATLRALRAGVERLSSIDDVQSWVIWDKDNPPKANHFYLAIFRESKTGFKLSPTIAQYTGYPTNSTTAEGWIINDKDWYLWDKDYVQDLRCVAWMSRPQALDDSDWMDD